jgi:aryl-alcohol dehydrogenase-like predicted oxidoreductase
VENDAALIAASPLHGGLLGSTRDQWKDKGRFEPLYDKLEAIENLLGEHAEGISRTGLRYLLSDERVSIVLCGPSNIEELETCASVSDGTHLPEDLIQAIEEA